MFARLLLGLALLGGCTRPASDYGRELFADPKLSTADSNAFACITCHETDAQPTHLRSGYTLYDSVARPTFWGGSSLTLLDAVNECLVEFMRGKPLTSTDDQGRALLAYLESISPDASAPALPLTVVANIVDVPSGDAALGKQLWDDGCGSCHGQPHTGEGRNSDKSSIVPDESLQMHGTDPTLGARPITIEKTRHGKFFGIGGNMAPFSLEALPDEQLGAILGYLESFGLPPSATPAPSP